jgi:hypothetical protein
MPFGDSPNVTPDIACKKFSKDFDIIKNAFDMFLTLKIGGKYKWFLNKNKKRFVMGDFYFIFLTLTGRGDPVRSFYVSLRIRT